MYRMIKHIKMSQIKQKTQENVNCNCIHGSCYNKHCISVSDICYSIKQLKHGKVMEIQVVSHLILLMVQENCLFICVYFLSLS